MRIETISKRILAGLALCVTLSTFPTDAVLAKTTSEHSDTTLVEVSDTLKDATVNLYCRLKAGKKTISTSGSGVVIHERGIILTNAHVAQYFLLEGTDGRVSGKCSVRTGSPAKETYTASLLYFPEVWLTENVSEASKKTPRGTGENDFAILYITSAKKGSLPHTFSTLTPDTLYGTREGESVTIAGYPTEKLDFKGVQKKLALVAASSTITNIRGFKPSSSTDMLTLAPSAAGSSGISGGPIINDDNDVIGIVTSKSATKGDRTLRAITLPYIERVLSNDIGLSLNTLISGDLAAHSSSTKTNISSDLIETLASALRKKR